MDIIEFNFAVNFTGRKYITGPGTIVNSIDHHNHRNRRGTFGEEMRIEFVCQENLKEFEFFKENCRIAEIWNRSADPQVSIARARVVPGQRTWPHSLNGNTERYLIASGSGRAISKVPNHGKCVRAIWPSFQPEPFSGLKTSTLRTWSSTQSAPRDFRCKITVTEAGENHTQQGEGAGRNPVSPGRPAVIRLLAALGVGNKTQNHGCASRMNLQQHLVWVRIRPLLSVFCPV
jgi:hypothetical protein